jgi:hypothetical protein
VVLVNGIMQHDAGMTRRVDAVAVCAARLGVFAMRALPNAATRGMQ